MSTDSNSGGESDHRIIKVKAHAIDGERYYIPEENLWAIRMRCEVEGEMKVVPILFQDEDSILSAEKFFKRPSIEPYYLEFAYVG